MITPEEMDFYDRHRILDRMDNISKQASRLAMCSAICVEYAWHGEKSPGLMQTKVDEVSDEISSIWANWESLGLPDPRAINDTKKRLIDDTNSAYGQDTEGC